MDRLNTGSEAFAAIDLTGAGGKTAPPGGIVLTYTNSSGIDMLVAGKIMFTSLVSGASTLSMYSQSTFDGHTTTYRGM